MKASRTDKRSRSGAQTKCPHCGKLLRGIKGATAHAREAHGLTIDAAAIIAASPSQTVRGG